MQNIIKW